MKTNPTNKQIQVHNNKQKTAKYCALPKKQSDKLNTTKYIFYNEILEI